MKEISIIAFEKRTAEVYGTILKKIFKSKIRVNCFSINDDLSNICSDLVIASTYTIYDSIRENDLKPYNIVIADITLKKESLKNLNHLPKGTKAMLVNSTLEMALDTIETIYNSGYDHLDLYPVYPNKKNIPDIDIAITPGEKQLVPKRVKEIIDLGDRVLSMKTIINVATKLKIPIDTQSPIIKEYFLNLVKTDIGFEDLFGQVGVLEKNLDILLKVSDDGILVLGNDYKINFINDIAKEILKIKDIDSNIVVKDLFEGSISEYLNMGEKSLKDKIVKLRDQHLVISIYPIKTLFDDIVYVIFIKRFFDTEKEQNRLRKQILEKGHVAKYEFNDIVGNSKSIVDAKNKAKLYSKSDSAVLICGKSGTGKELFAQSIHNNSLRKNNPFIAINCASIPENLLESELFGYEPGAFTGANKSGRLGYFELAHTGTLFLDEISELDYKLQARLLRVLQEKEVIRIGGDNVINVDVRIISSTNKDLLKLIKENKFREDLYYRINVLRVDIPKLENRNEDIELLIKTFVKEENGNIQITDSDMNFLKRYNWPGNIRELRNFVERLICLNKHNIDRDDIIQCLDFEILEDYNESINTGDEPIRSFIETVTPKFSLYKAIFQILYDAEKYGENLGRRSISNKLNSYGIILSEQEVRTILEFLRNQNMVLIRKGRGGTKLTDLGTKTLQQMIIR